MFEFTNLSGQRRHSGDGFGTSLPRDNEIRVCGHGLR